MIRPPDLPLPKIQAVAPLQRRLRELSPEQHTGVHRVHGVNALQKGSKLKFPLQSVLWKNWSSSWGGRPACWRCAAWTLDGRASPLPSTALGSSLPPQSIAYAGADSLGPFSSRTSESFRVQKATHLLGNYHRIIES